MATKSGKSSHDTRHRGILTTPPPHPPPPVQHQLLGHNRPASTQDTPTIVNSSGILRFRPFRTSHFHELVYRSTTPLLCPTQLRAVNTSKSGVSGDWDFYIHWPAGPGAGFLISWPPLLPDREDSTILIDSLLVNLLSSPNASYSTAPCQPQRELYSFFHLPCARGALRLHRNFPPYASTI